MNARKIMEGRSYAVRESRHHKGVRKALVLSVHPHETPTTKRGAERHRKSNRIRIVYEGEEHVREVFAPSVVRPWDTNGAAPQGAEWKGEIHPSPAPLRRPTPGEPSSRATRIASMCSVLDFNTGRRTLFVATRDDRIFALTDGNNGNEWVELPGLPK